MKGFLVAALAASATLTACSQFDDPADEDYEVVADGKEDNYRSPSALEFLAKSDATTPGKASSSISPGACSTARTCITSSRSALTTANP